MTHRVLAADLGGTNTRVSAVTADGSIVASLRRKTPSSGDAEAIAAEIAGMACELIGQNGTHEGPFAFGVGAAALVNLPTGTVYSSPNLPQLDGRNLGPMISEGCGLPVTLENDANAAAVGEAWLGAARGTSASICVTLGTGVGGGIILDGRLWRGVDGTAGEIGHICVEPEGVQCGCGSRGCLEQYASATAMSRIALELARDFPDSLLLQHDGPNSYDVFVAAEAGDQAAKEAFRTSGHYLGIALAGLVNTLNPDTIVLAGGASLAWPYFIDETLNEMKYRAFRRPAERVKLVRAELGDTAGILGAARLAFDSLHDLT